MTMIMRDITTGGLLVEGMSTEDIKTRISEAVGQKPVEFRTFSAGDIISKNESSYGKVLSAIDGIAEKFIRKTENVCNGVYWFDVQFNQLPRGDLSLVVEFTYGVKSND